MIALILINEPFKNINNTESEGILLKACPVFIEGLTST